MLPLSPAFPCGKVAKGGYPQPFSLPKPAKVSIIEIPLSHQIEEGKKSPTGNTADRFLATQLPISTIHGHHQRFPKDQPLATRRRVECLRHTSIESSLLDDGFLEKTE
jgi:hypothetical protein